MPPEKETPQTTEQKPPIKSLRTYQGDVEEAVIKNKYSASSILVAEQNRKDKTLIDFDEKKDQSARNKFIIMVGSILLVLGSITIASMFYLRSQNEVIVQKQTKALISFTEEKPLLLASSPRDKFISDIIALNKSFSLPVNSVLYINTIGASNTPMTVESVLKLIAPQMSSSLVRSYDSEYMLGIYSFDTNEPFIILTTSDYASSFSGMLKWESTMPYDLDKLFSVIQKGVVDFSFKDETLQNKDLRVLKNDNNKTVLLYSFIDKNTLVITANENILTAIIGKYNVSRQTR